MIRNGFTLAEMLVSLFIFGLLAAAGVALLSFSAASEGNSAARMEEAGQFRRAGTLLASDLAQVVARGARDEGGAVQPAFEGGNGQTLLAFVRGGWENPDAEARSSLQKVAYRLADGRLERIAYPQVDGAAPFPPVTVLNGVRSIRLRFRDRSGAWLDRWSAEKLGDLPRAVELDLELPRDGAVRQLFLVGGGR